MSPQACLLQSLLISIVGLNLVQVEYEIDLGEPGPRMIGTQATRVAAAVPLSHGVTKNATESTFSSNRGRFVADSIPSPAPGLRPKTLAQPNQIG